MAKAREWPVIAMKFMIELYPRPPGQGMASMRVSKNGRKGRFIAARGCERKVRQRTIDPVACPLFAVL